MALTTHRNADAIICYQRAEPIQPLLDGVGVEQWFDLPHRPLKQTVKIDARVLQLPAMEAFVKRYRVASRLRRWLVALTGYRARRMFRVSLRLRQAGVPVPQPFAHVRERRRDCLSSFFVCEALQARDLKTLAKGPGLEQAGGEIRVFEQVAALLSALHLAGFSHGDMKWANLMVDNHTQKVLLIDLDGLRRPWMLRNRRFGRDLARFMLNARELGVAADRVDGLLTAYAKTRGRSVKQLRADLAPSYKKLAKRHRKKYGTTVS